MIKKGKSKLLKVLNKHEKTYNIMLLSTMILMGISTQSYATTPKLVTGTVDLFKTATTWLLLIIPVGAGLFLGYHALQKSLSDDQGVIAEKNKLMKNVLIGSAVATTASGLVTIVLSFYV